MNDQRSGIALARSFFKAAALGAGLLAGSAHGQVPPAPAANPASSAISNPGVTRLDRTVRLTGAIGPKEVTEVIDELRLLAEQSGAPIELRLHSPGGQVNAGLAIYDYLRSIPNEVTTVCEGESSSMAAFLLILGEEGRRVAYPNCQIMLHQISAGVNGQAANMQIAAESISALSDRVYGLLSNRTGWPVEMITELLDRDRFITPREALEMGLIDRIVPSVKPDIAPSRPRLPESFCQDRSRRNLKLCEATPARTAALAPRNDR